MPVPAQHVVYRVPVRDAAEQRARISCKRMKSGAIDDHREQLVRAVINSGSLLFQLGKLTY